MRAEVKLVSARKQREVKERKLVLRDVEKIRKRETKLADGIVVGDTDSVEDDETGAATGSRIKQKFGQRMHRIKRLKNGNEKPSSDYRRTIKRTLSSRRSKRRKIGQEGEIIEEMMESLDTICVGFSDILDPWTHLDDLESELVLATNKVFG